MMKYAPTLVFLIFGITTVIGVTVNDSYQSLEETTTEPDFSNKTARRGKFLHVDVIELPGPVKKRQIIRIPPNVSKVKLIRPTIIHDKYRPREQIKRFYRVPPNGMNTKKSETEEYEFEFEEPPQFYKTKKVKKVLKKVKVKNISPQEVNNDEVEFEMEKGHERVHNFQRVSDKKKTVKHVLGDYLVNYERDSQKERPSYEEGGYGSTKNRYKSTDGERTVYGYDSAGSSVHMKQVPAPNLFALKVVNPPEMANQANQIKTPTFPKFHDDNYISGMNIKPFSMRSRQTQSLFPQKYTTHNPHVPINFGLNNVGGLNGYPQTPKKEFVGTSPYVFPPTMDTFGQQTMAASNHIVTSLPVLTPGIQVIQPPQFKDVTVNHASHPSRLASPLIQSQEESPSQRATIRDILEKDCPLYDIKGYCESPPRYPMQQISGIVKKCASFMDLMNTQPFDEPHDVYTFAKKADHQVDGENITETSEGENVSNWSRSSNGDSTACLSDITITEPGYAKEVMSERWFVVVQHPDTIIQRIATDTCTDPGKPCGGLTGLKCSKIKGLSNKYTRCIQRFTYQRLVSWDPEYPEGCPRIRLFRFPSACVCHLDAI